MRTINRLPTTTMPRRRFISSVAVLLLFLIGIVPSRGLAAEAAAQGQTATAITTLTNAQGNADHLSLGLGDDLGVALDGNGTVDASKFVLFFNGREVSGVGSALFDAKLHRLIFHIQRDPNFAAAWTALLGAPLGLHKTVAVSLGVATAGAQSPQPSIVGTDGNEPTFDFQTISVVRLLIAMVVIVAMLVLVWGSAKRTPILKDNLIPQIDPERQTYSLGRWQMAVWFSLVFTSYVFLFILLNDPNTLSEQALMLMGISGATALAAVAVDAAKDTPSDAVNAGLRLLGINSWTDVIRIKAEIKDREAQLASKTNPPLAAASAKLTAEILDRQYLLRSYEDAIKPFVSQGWFRDIVTDLNGPALHRLQVVCWTLLLGGIFLYEVWHDLSMPQFSSTLLALMGVSGAGYVGFKFPESQQ